MCDKLQHSTSQSDTWKTLGRAIPVRRKTLTFSQNDLAGMIDVDDETISRFERGTVLPSLRRLWRVAEALQVSLSGLLSQASQLSEDQTQKLVTAIRNLSEKDRQLPLDFASLLRNR